MLFNPESIIEPFLKGRWKIKFRYWTSVKTECNAHHIQLQRDGQNRKLTLFYSQENTTHYIHVFPITITNRTWQPHLSHLHPNFHMVISMNIGITSLPLCFLSCQSPVEGHREWSKWFWALAWSLCSSSEGPKRSEIYCYYGYPPCSTATHFP